MSERAYGPVPLSRIKVELPGILSALAADRPVLLSRSGEAFAIIDPPSATDPTILAAYTADSPAALPELTATAVNHADPAPAVLAATNGTPCLLTQAHRVCGLIRAVRPADFPTIPTYAQLAEREKHLTAYLSTHPNTTVDDLADFAAALDQLIVDTPKSTNCPSASRPDRSRGPHDPPSHSPKEVKCLATLLSPPSRWSTPTKLAASWTPQVPA